MIKPGPKMIEFFSSEHRILFCFIRSSEWASSGYKKCDEMTRSVESGHLSQATLGLPLAGPLES